MSGTMSTATSFSSSRHTVAVIGGAVSGAEIAGYLADLGISVVVFDQNPRPYGKVEDGLPRWHHRLREKEYKNINEKLSRPGVEFVPNTRIGRDIDFLELINDWGFSAVVLANGAWRDRPLPIEGADDYVGKGLIYQNPFVMWFNHLEEQGHEGETFEIQDNGIVVGGGLASIDVAKILMLETTRAKLAERGIEEDMIELETKGIPKALSIHGLELRDLDLEGCTIFYRRGLADMPLVLAPEDATPERIEKVRKSRITLLEKAIRKFGFKIEPNAAPDSLIVEDGEVKGLVFRRTRIEGNRVVMTDETFEHRGSCVISSIGSIPEPIPGLEMKGELVAFDDWSFGRMKAYPTLFAVGNVITGKGNIAVSRKHAHYVGEDAIEAFLGVGDSAVEFEEAIPGDIVQQARETAEHVAERLRDTPSGSEREVLAKRVRDAQAAVGYDGDLANWLAQVAPKPR